MTVEAAAVHHLGDAINPLQAILVRSLGGVVLVAVLARRTGFAVFRTETLWLQFVRAGLTMVSLWCLFYGFAALPLADATAVTYIRAVFTGLFAVILLGEKVGAARWLSILAGIVGGLLVIRPAFAAWRPDYLVALAGSALNAGAMVATKVLGRRDSTLTVMTWVTALSLVCCLPALASPWPGIEAWPWLLAIAATGTTGLYTGLMAIRAADLSVLAPFDYTRLLIAALIGVTFFHEWPDWMSVIGATIITLACVASAITVHPFYRRKR
jgi:drug/metabolite transporter (DMT)-like permease